MIRLQVKTIPCRIMMTLITQMMLFSPFCVWDSGQLIRALNYLLPSPAWPALRMLLSLKMLPVYKPVDPSKECA